MASARPPKASSTLRHPPAQLPSLPGSASHSAGSHSPWACFLPRRIPQPWALSNPALSHFTPVTSSEDHLSKKTPNQCNTRDFLQKPPYAILEVGIILEAETIPGISQMGAIWRKCENDAHIASAGNSFGKAISKDCLSERAPSQCATQLSYRATLRYPGGGYHSHDLPEMHNLKNRVLLRNPKNGSCFQNWYLGSSCARRPQVASTGWWETWSSEEAKGARHDNAGRRPKASGI